MFLWNKCFTTHNIVKFITYVTWVTKWGYPGIYWHVMLSLCHLSHKVRISWHLLTRHAISMSLELQSEDILASIDTSCYLYVTWVTKWGYPGIYWHVMLSLCHLSYKVRISWHLLTRHAISMSLELQSEDILASIDTSCYLYVTWATKWGYPSIYWHVMLSSWLNPQAMIFTSRIKI